MYSYTLNFRDGCDFIANALDLDLFCPDSLKN